ncbi:hypothetical protein Mal4_18470 [Maioricimonas rarisocia]|uniref:DUF1800 domain-containing protein n=1 Tax=Maioricimonas rarisocia TaxID=2528026 RepID=A0A517Z509_9PLAN|nr:DUF1800 domain-containing protein [Maioricimonas rarisocia]QDU37533.1 hypothetical protein Mal4_18470 [Maioricimonas rarisocia]
MNRPQHVDPEWAWSPYSPDAQTPWTRALAAHLYRRAGFAATTQQLDDAVAQSPGEVLQDLMQPGRESQDYANDIDDLARANLATGDPKKMSAWWLYRMLTTPAQLQEKATLFWHGHFATGAEKVEDADLVYGQYRLLREHATGDFGALLHGISRDPAMLIYLDSATNRKSHPNENYAREIMELFALGEGAYTEQDIRELARCFTGWEVRRGKFRFNRYQHDFGEKTVLGTSGKLGGDEGVDVVLAQSTAPQFIVRKLIRFYVCDEPEASDELVAPLAREFRDSGLQVGPVIQRILSSNLFFSSHSRGRKVRSPIELGVGFLRALNGTTGIYELAAGMAQIGQELFYPPNVKGWDGGRTWINSSTLLGRANLIRSLLESDKTRFSGATLEELVDREGLQKPHEIVDWLAELLFAVPVPETVRERVTGVLESNDGDRENRLRNALTVLCTLPEFQLA